MLTRRAHALLCTAGLVAAIGCSRGADPCTPGGEHGVVACYGGSPITRAELEPHLRPARPVRGRAALPDPRALALEAALRVRVFADEARRRGLPIEGDSTAHRRASGYQALRRALAAEHGATAEQVSDDEARRYYRDHPGRFNKIPEVHVRIIVVDDPTRAEALFAELEGAGEEAFAAAARASSRHPSAVDGGAIGETHRPGIDPAITRLSNDLRHEGELGGPVALESGGYAILMATDLEMAIRPFAEVSTQVGNHIAHEREEAALDAAYAELRSQAPIVVFTEELERLPLPGD